MKTWLHLSDAMLNEVEPIFRSEIKGSLTAFLHSMQVGEWYAFDMDDLPEYRHFHSAARLAGIKIAVRKHPQICVWIVQRIS